LNGKDSKLLGVFLNDIKVSGKSSTVSSRYPHFLGDACWLAMLKLDSLEWVFLFCISQTVLNILFTFCGKQAALFKLSLE